MDIKFIVKFVKKIKITNGIKIIKKKTKIGKKIGWKKIKNTEKNT